MKSRGAYNTLRLSYSLMHPNPLFPVCYPVQNPIYMKQIARSESYLLKEISQITLKFHLSGFVVAVISC